MLHASHASHAGTMLQDLSGKKKVTKMLHFLPSIHGFSQYLGVSPIGSVTVPFKYTLEVQDQTKWLVFRMIHGARIPEPTKGQSLVFGLPEFLGIYTLEVQPPFLKGWFPNHHDFSRSLSSSKRNHHVLNGG